MFSCFLAFKSNGSSFFSFSDLAEMKRLHRSFLYKVGQNVTVTSFILFLSLLNGTVTSFLMFENFCSFSLLRYKKITEGGRL
jgi:hypothetical protein